MAAKVFPEGIRVFTPRSSAPKFMKASIVITPNDLFAWLKKQPELLSEYNGAKQLKLDLMEGREGKLYLSVNTFKTEPKEEDEQLPF
jgi:hypothetical protein